MTENALRHDEIECLIEDGCREGIGVRKAWPLDAHHVLTDLFGNCLVDQPSVRFYAKIAIGLEIGNQQATGPKTATAEIQHVMMVAQS